MTFDSKYEYNVLMERINTLRGNIEDVLQSELSKSQSKGARAVLFTTPKLNEIESYLESGSGDIFTTMYRIINGLTRVQNELDVFIHLPTRPSPKSSPKLSKKSSSSPKTPKKSPPSKTAKPKRSSMVVSATVTKKGKGTTKKRVSFA